jgi:hypothetical protein
MTEQGSGQAPLVLGTLLLAAAAVLLLSLPDRVLFLF